MINTIILVINGVFLFFMSFYVVKTIIKVAGK